jgi:arginine utilization regulatory protein
VITLEMPSLVERADEFDTVLHGCLDEVCRELGRSILEISEEVACRFETYHWPGNFRELRHVLEYAVQASEGTRVELRHLPLWFDPRRGADHAVPAALGVAEFPFSSSYYESLLRFEQEFLRRALSRYGGRINRTAREIGMSKTTLIRRMRGCGVAASV